MITHHWINTAGLTKGIIKYYDFIRLLSRTGIMVVLRNKFDAQAGLWVVADDTVIDQMVKTIKMTIQGVEDRGNKKKLIKEAGIHGAEQRSKYKRKFLKNACDKLMAEFDELKANRTEDENRIQRDYDNLLKEYIQNTPSLKILKSLKYYANNPK